MFSIYYWIIQARSHSKIGLFSSVIWQMCTNKYFKELVIMTTQTKD